MLCSSWATVGEHAHRYCHGLSLVRHRFLLVSRCLKLPDSAIPQRPPGHRPMSTRVESIRDADGSLMDSALPYNVFLSRSIPQGPGLQASTTFSAGLGFFPSLLGLQLSAPPQLGRAPNGAPPRVDIHLTELSPEQAQQVFLSRLLLILGSFVIVCLLLF